MDKYKPMLIDANEIVTTMVMDEKTKTGTLIKMPIADALDKWTAEGCPKPIEAEPVKYGRWIKNEGRSGWHCSCCGKDNLYAYPYAENNERELQDFYCPNCGAKMDAQEEPTP